jgi:SET domain-containing protein
VDARVIKTPALVIRPSEISGLGAFARRPIRKGARVIEYRGERISPGEADARYADDADAHPHVLLFTVDSRTVIDGGAGGNEARFINHSCSPNCEAVTEGQRIWIYALENIAAGQELTYDYNLTGDPPDLAARRREYPCNCGSPNCRGTMFKIE